MKLLFFISLLLLSTVILHAQDSTHTKTMSAVTVEGGKPAIRVSASKIVVNLAASPLAAGGNLLEALLRTPGINGQGDLLFRGKKILLLLDGVDTHLSGDDLKTMLASLPTTGIDRIEVLVSPSARYDAKGAVVVNVLSVRDKTMGASATLMGGSRFGQSVGGNGGLSLRYRQHHFNSTLSYDYSGSNLFTTATASRPIDSLRRLQENASGHRSAADQTIRSIMEYTPSEKTTLSLQASLLIYRHNLANNTHDRLLDSATLTRETRTSHYLMPAIDLSYTCKRDSTGRLLTLRAGYLGYSKTTADRLFTTTDDAATHAGIPISSVNYDAPAHNHIATITADYTLPTRFARWELGGKFTSAVTDNRWLPDAGLSDHFIYRETVSAAYLSGDKTIGKVSLRGGLRLEQTHTNGRSLSLDSVYDHNYTNLFPSVSIGYQSSADHQWSLAYKRSIQRFDFDVVNPFIRYQSPYTWYRGNPAIRPELEQSIDLGYSYKDALVLSAGCLYVNDVLAEVYQKQGEALQSSYANLGHGLQYSLNMAYNASFFNGAWSSTTSLMGIYASYIGTAGPGFTNSGYSVFISSDHSVRLPGGWKAEVSAVYTGPLAFGVYRFRSNTSTDLGLSKSCWNSKGKLTLSLTDVFNTSSSRYYIEGMGIGAYNTRKTESRILRLGFSYRFGNKNLTPARPKQRATEQESQRLSTAG